MVFRILNRSHNAVPSNSIGSLFTPWRRQPVYQTAPADLVEQYHDGEQDSEAGSSSSFIPSTPSQKRRSYFPPPPEFSDHDGPDDDDEDIQLSPESITVAKRILSLWCLFPVMTVMTLNHGFQHIIPTFIHKEDQSLVTLRSVLLALGAGSSFISTPFWTTLGDRHGRRSVLLITLAGAILPNLCLILVHQTKLNYVLYLIGIVCEGLLGGFTTFRAIVYAYTADCAPAIHRLGIFSLLQGISFLSFISPDWIITDIYKLDDINQLSIPVVSLTAALVITFLAVLLFLPETTTTPKNERPLGGLTGLKIWIPSNPFRRATSSVGMALFAFSFLTAWDEGYGFRRSPAASRPGMWDVVLKCIRYFIVLPALVVLRPRVRTFSPVQWDFVFTIFSTVLVTALSILLLWALVVISLSNCGTYCVDFYIIFSLMWALIIIVPNLFAVGGLPALYSLAAGYYQEAGRQFEWGLLFGRLSILQSLAEGLITQWRERITGNWNDDSDMVVVTLFSASCLVQCVVVYSIWRTRRPFELSFR